MSRFAWCVSVVLTRQQAGGIDVANSLHVRHGAKSEDEAKGGAVTVAIENYPGYAVAMVNAIEVNRGEKGGA